MSSVFEVQWSMYWSKSNEVPWRMSFLPKKSVRVAWWMSFNISVKTEIPFSIKFSNVVRVPWRMQLDRSEIPWSLQTRELSKYEVLWEIPMLTLDALGVLPFVLVYNSVDYPIFEGTTVTFSQQGVMVGTLKTSRAFPLGALISVEAIGETWRMVLVSGLVTVSENTDDLLVWTTSIKDPVYARTGGKVLTGSGTALQVLTDLITQNGGVLLVDSIDALGGALVDVDVSVAWTEYVSRLEAILGGILYLNTSGEYVLDNSSTIWEIAESDEFAVTEAINSADYVNTVALTIDDEWEEEAARSKVTTKFNGAVMIIDAAGEQLYSMETSIGSASTSKLTWTYDEYNRVIATRTEESSISSGTISTMECSLATLDDTVYVSDKIETSARIEGSAENPLRDWDTKDVTSVKFYSGETGIIMEKTETHMYFEQET